jgi:clan AA aspartic protease (TIGR02281 family)
MKCRKCHSEYAAGANFCPQCGAGLGRSGKGPQIGRRILTLVLLALFAGWAFYFFRGMIFPFRPAAPTKSFPEVQPSSPPATSDRPLPAEQPANQEKPALQAAAVVLPEPPPAVPAAPETDKRKLLPVGVVSVYDAWGNEIAAVSTVVIDRSWLALPGRACFGGVKWIFRFSPLGFAASIDGGLWRLGDDVGLWHLEKPLDIESVSLAPWQDAEKTTWSSLLAGREAHDLALLPDWQQGFLLHTSSAGLPDETGVFLQNGKVCGWTFGGWLAGGYLWAGAPDLGEVPAITVAEFYNMTFAGGREEQFVRALAMDEQTPAADRLQALLTGFLLEPKLAAGDVPETLSPENILVLVRALAGELYRRGNVDKLTQLLDDDAIQRTGDAGLLKIAAEARLAGRGFADAVDFVERTAAGVRGDGGSDELAALHLRLYQQWLEDELARGNLAEAGEVLARSARLFADDPRLHLDGVELALAGGDWAWADGLLRERDYPAAMIERVNLLASRISQMKMREGEIVISFAPGSHQIHVNATINNRVSFPFLVDTGASLVAVPAGLLPALGLEIRSNAPRYRVATAGGMKEAWKVTLSSIELEGWVVRDVEALVVDTDEQAGFGLLGLNFLNRFQMHLDSDEGVLILKPQ